MGKYRVVCSVMCSQCGNSGPSADVKFRARVLAHRSGWLLLPGTTEWTCPDCQTAMRRVDMQEAADLELEKMP